MWKIARLLKRSFCILSLLLLSLPSFSQSDSGAVTLTREEIRSIQNELNATRAETRLLVSLSEESKADLAEWQRKCGLLEEKLARASQDLESCGKSVIELREETEMLRKLLDGLRAEFSELSKSYSRQKKKTAFWRTASIVSILAAAIEGGIIWLSK